MEGQGKKGLELPVLGEEAHKSSEIAILYKFIRPCCSPVGTSTGLAVFPQQNKIHPDQGLGEL